jgi:hypothetical protein
MHFLLGFLIVCIILAVPALRKVALVIAGLCGVGALLLLLASGSNRNNGQPAPDPAELTRVQQAAQAWQAEQDAALRRIKPAEIEIRQLWLTSRSEPLTAFKTIIDGPGVSATIKNNSPQFRLSELCFKITIFDCVASQRFNDAQCEQIGGFTVSGDTDIPPAQVRQVDLRMGYFEQLKGIPRLRGDASVRYEICRLRGKL